MRLFLLVLLLSTAFASATSLSFAINGKNNGTIQVTEGDELNTQLIVNQGPAGANASLYLYDIKNPSQKIPLCKTKTEEGISIVNCGPTKVEGKIDYPQNKTFAVYAEAIKDGKIIAEKDSQKEALKLFVVLIGQKPATIETQVKLNWLTGRGIYSRNFSGLACPDSTQKFSDLSVKVTCKNNALRIEAQYAKEKIKDFQKATAAFTVLINGKAQEMLLSVEKDDFNPQATYLTKDKAFNASKLGGNYTFAKLECRTAGKNKDFVSAKCFNQTIQLKALADSIYPIALGLIVTGAGDYQIRIIPVILPASLSKFEKPE